MHELSTALETLIGQPFLITSSPQALDFTNPKAPANLVVIAKGRKIEIPLSHKQGELIKSLGGLKYYLSQAKVLLAWDAKNLFSYIRKITGKSLQLSVPIIDLKVLGAFLGMSEPCPETLTAAVKRLEVMTGNPSWPQLKTLYKSIHIPLIAEIIPEIETLGLVDTNRKAIVHPYYEIEGQANGRMRCTEPYQKSFNPHTLSEDDKETLTTPDFDDKEFVYFDFKNMEVAVLTWLSKDKVLQNILERGRDVYESIWEALTGLESSPSRRKICKAFFLPVVFGMGAKSLAERTEVAEETAKKLVDRIYTIFSTAMGWIASKDVNENRVGTDYYGRHRKFEEEYYRTQLRNFHVQAPASIVCLHKLVKLYKLIGKSGKISFHVHDGYCIIPKRGEENKILKIGRDALEEGEELYPGLRLRVKAYRGTNLNKLKEIE